MGQVTFNTQRQRYEFVDSPDNANDLSPVICNENDNKCYLFTDTGETDVSTPFYFLF